MHATDNPPFRYLYQLQVDKVMIVKIWIKKKLQVDDQGGKKFKGCRILIWSRAQYITLNFTEVLCQQDGTAIVLRISSDLLYGCHCLHFVSYVTVVIL